MLTNISNTKQHGHEELSMPKLNTEHGRSWVAAGRLLVGRLAGKWLFEWSHSTLRGERTLGCVLFVQSGFRRLLDLSCVEPAHESTRLRGGAGGIIKHGFTSTMLLASLEEFCVSSGLWTHGVVINESIRCFGILWYLVLHFLISVHLVDIF